MINKIKERQMEQQLYISREREMKGSNRREREWGVGRVKE
jgi:hypothetical protein